MTFESQIQNLWIVVVLAGFNMTWYARNCVIHKDGWLSLVVAFGFVRRSICEANLLNKGNMINSFLELVTLRKLGVEIFRAKAPMIINVIWRLPEPYWIKLNIDEADLGQPSFAREWSIFHSSRGFVKGCFVVHLGHIFAFEAELLAMIQALEIAKEYSWENLWLKYDS